MFDGAGSDPGPFLCSHPLGDSLYLLQRRAAFDSIGKVADDEHVARDVPKLRHEPVERRASICCASSPSFKWDAKDWAGLRDGYVFNRDLEGHVGPQRPPPRQVVEAPFVRVRQAVPGPSVTRAICFAFCDVAFLPEILSPASDTATWDLPFCLPLWRPEPALAWAGDQEVVDAAANKRGVVFFLYHCPSYG